NHTCGLKTDKTIACWGNNYGSLYIIPDGHFKTVSVGSYHMCGVRINNTIICKSPNLIATPFFVTWL
ncbi:MAG: hypothetical protein OXI96_02675, partial [Acidimicrobiaceae bacterium]|nr:hypothetical protein [Acidimicrobiaceae bacterium]